MRKRIKRSVTGHACQNVDVYYDWFGIYLPDALYNYSHWIAMGLGSILFAAGKQSNPNQ